MGNYENLKEAVSDVIKTNGNQEITGAVLQSTLLSIISSVGKNATFAGIATPGTNPGTPDQNVFYIASDDGTYSNFGGITLTGEVAIFRNTGSSWEKLDTGIPKNDNILGVTNQIVFTDDEELNKIISELYLDKNKVDISNCQVLQVQKNKSGERYIFRFYIDSPRQVYVGYQITDSTIAQYPDETKPFEIKKDDEVVGYVVVNWDRATNLVKNVTLNDNCYYLQNCPIISLYPLMPDKNSITDLENRMDVIEGEVGSLGPSVDYINENAFCRTTLSGTLLRQYDFNLFTAHNLTIGEKYCIYAKTDKKSNLVQNSATGPIVLISELNGEGVAEFTASRESENFGFFIFENDSINYTISVGTKANIEESRLKLEEEIKKNATVIENANENITEQNSKISNLENPLENCIFMSLGDSIFTEGYFMPKLRDLIKPSKYYNLAVAGATWADKAGTTSYNGNPTFEGDQTQNVLGNQLQKILNGLDSTYSEAPDYILIGAITNDSISSLNDLNDSTIIDFIRNQFFDNDNNCIPITAPTFDVVDTYKDYRKNVAGAMRYVVTKLQEIYPDAIIIISTPIQGSLKTKPYIGDIGNINAIGGVEAKQRFIKHCCNYLSLRVIHTGEECGILQDYEFEGAKWTYEKYADFQHPQRGRDLIDGTHPNPNTGGLKMAKYIYRKMCDIVEE